MFQEWAGHQSIAQKGSGPGDQDEETPGEALNDDIYIRMLPQSG